MKPGIELMADERQFKQIEKHGFTAEHHADHPEWYDKRQLISAAQLLFSQQSNGYYIRNKICPLNWNEDWFVKLLSHTYEKRLVIAGAFVASEIDRLQELEKRKKANLEK